MVFDLSLSSNEEIETLYNQIMEELIEWYKFNWSRNKPKIFVIEDKATFEAVYGREPKNWVRGTSDYADNIFVYSKEAALKYTVHNENDEEYYSFLKHELDHKFFYAYTEGLKRPNWLIEGNAEYVSGKVKRVSNLNKFENFLEMDREMKSYGYYESGNAVKLLIERVGKDKYLKFLKSLANKDFQEELQKTFDLKLDYKSFNKLLD